MPKINIYVPDDMKARMDGAGERANWSAVAQRAFGVELSLIESIKEIKSMSNVIERLRSSKVRKIAELQQQGRALGIEWAKNRAEYDQLKRAIEVDTEGFFGPAFTSDLDARNWVARKILAEPFWDEVDPQDRHLAMSSLFGISEDMLHATVTMEYLKGFIDGATEVWDEVADQL